MPRYLLVSELHDKAPPTEPPNRDAVTVALLVAGNQQGLRQLLEDHGGVVRLRLLKQFHKMLDDSELDEVMGLAAIRVWRTQSRFDATLGTLRAWFFVIARNCVLTMLAKRRNSPLELCGNLDGFGVGETPPPTPRRQQLVADTHACLEELPPMQRAILQADLEAGEAVSAQELAVRLKTSPNSIYVSRLKGREALRKALARIGHFGIAEFPAARANRREFGAETG